MKHTYTLSEEVARESKAKRITTVCALFLFLTITPYRAEAQGIYDTYSGFTVPVNPVLPQQEIHPSLWFNSSAVDSVRNKKNSNSYSASVWNSVQSLINTFKSYTPASTNINIRPKMAKILGLNWVLYGDTTSRRKAIECLMIAYDNVPRTATTANFGGDYDEIYRATWLQNYCSAYDWIQNQLTPEQDSTIRAKIIAEVLLLRNNMVSGVRYAPRPHNHRSKPAYGIITAALTFTSDSRASDWLQFGLEQANTCSKYQFSSDGIYREGSHYLMYTAVNFIPYLWQYRQVSGVDHYQYFKPVFELPVKIRSKKGWLTNIEDGYIKPFPTHMVADGYKYTSTELHPVKPLAEILQWHWNTTNFITKDYTGATNDVVWEIVEYLTYNPGINPSAPDIKGTQKTNSGVVVFRDNDNPASNSRYLYFNGVAEGDNHQHPDLLSYIMEANGTIISIDAGYGKDGFSDSKRTWYTAPYAHNIVTTDSAAPYDMSVNIPPADKHFIMNPAADYAEKQTKTKINGGSIKRGILFPHKKYWVIFDAAGSNIPANYRLYLHNRGTLAAMGDDYTWTTPSDIFGTPQKLFTTVLGNESKTTTVKSGYTSLWKDEIVQTYLEVKQTRDTVLFMHLLYPDSVSASSPNMVKSETPAYISLTLGTAEKDLFILKKRNTIDTINNIVSDGTILWTNLISDSLKKFAAIDAKTFSFANGFSFTSDQRIAVVGEILFDTINMTIDTLPGITQFLLASPFPIQQLSAVKLNGIPLQYGVLDGKIELTLNTGGNLQILFNPADTGEENVNPVYPKDFGLIGNYPNPFNPTTRIRFYSNGNTGVTLEIIDMSGRLIKTLFTNETLNGYFDRIWDGTDNLNKKVPSGIYLFKITDQNVSDYKKGILLR